MIVESTGDTGFTKGKERVRGWTLVSYSHQKPVVIFRHWCPVWSSINNISILNLTKSGSKSCIFNTFSFFPPVVNTLIYRQVRFNGYHHHLINSGASCCLRPCNTTIFTFESCMHAVLTVLVARLRTSPSLIYSVSFADDLHFPQQCCRLIRWLSTQYLNKSHLRNWNCRGGPDKSSSAAGTIFLMRRNCRNNIPSHDIIQPIWR